MYKRVNELRDQKKIVGANKLANKIGISVITLQKVIEGKTVLQSTEKLIDIYLDNYQKSGSVIVPLLNYIETSGESITDISQKIGISAKSLYNIIKQKENMSDSMQKIIKNFLKL